MPNRFSQEPPRREAIENLEAAALRVFFDTQVSDRPLVAFTPLDVQGIKVDALGCHYGIDRTLYYDVYCGGKKLIGMNDWRLEEFLGRVEEGILPSLPGSVKPLVKKEPERRRAELPKSARKLKKGGPHL